MREYLHRGLDEQQAPQMQNAIMDLADDKADKDGVMKDLPGMQYKMNDGIERPKMKDTPPVRMMKDGDGGAILGEKTSSANNVERELYHYTFSRPIKQFKVIYRGENGDQNYIWQDWKNVTGYNQKHISYTLPESSQGLFDFYVKTDDGKEQTIHVKQNGFSSKTIYFDVGPIKPAVEKWDVKTSGAPSGDNCAEGKGDFQGALGPGAMFQGSDTRCGIELKATIKDFDPSYTYDVKRTMKLMRAKYLVSGEWRDEPRLSENDQDDDTGEYKDWDECLNATATNPFLYSLDAPGFIAGFNDYPSGATEYVLFFDMEEFVKMTSSKNVSYIDPNKQSWCAIVWISKTDSTWKVNKTKSYIGSGNMTMKLIMNQAKK